MPVLVILMVAESVYRMLAPGLTSFSMFGTLKNTITDFLNFLIHFANNNIKRKLPVPGLVHRKKLTYHTVG
jgi:hypothetical protein